MADRATHVALARGDDGNTLAGSASQSEPGTVGARRERPASILPEPLPEPARMVRRRSRCRRVPPVNAEGRDGGR